MMLVELPCHKGKNKTSFLTYTAFSTLFFPILSTLSLKGKECGGGYFSPFSQCRPLYVKYLLQ